ncbi:MAG: NAD(P)/FAD-dependent oxidoreductase [Actinomycetota bacterium]
MTDQLPLPESVDVAVVGAGLAGLAAARIVAGAGRSIVVLEASDGVGGRVRSDIVDGFVLDRGFQILLRAYPELDRQFDVDALDLRSFDPGALVRIGDDLSLLGDPLRKPTTLPASLASSVGRLGDKLRLLKDRARLARTDTKQILRQPDTATRAGLKERGYSDAMIDRFFRPFVGGIQLDPTLSTSNRMFDVVLQQLFRADAVVPAKGMGQIPAQLAERLPAETIHLDTPVTSVRPGVVTTNRGEVKATDIIVAVEGPAASDLLGLPAVESNPATCVWFAADAAPIDAPLLVLDGDGPALNIAVMSNVSPDYAPAGKALVGGACPGLLDPDAEPAVRAQLRRIWGAQVDDWRHLRTDAIPHGQPAQPPSFPPKQRTVLGEGLHVCGDHRDTASIQGALFSGRRCAEAVLASA